MTWICVRDKYWQMAQEPPPLPSPRPASHSKMHTPGLCPVTHLHQQARLPQTPWAHTQHTPQCPMTPSTMAASSPPQAALQAPLPNQPGPPAKPVCIHPSAPLTTPSLPPDCCCRVAGEPTGAALHEPNGGGVTQHNTAQHSMIQHSTVWCKGEG